MRRRLRFLFIALACALVATACGGGGEGQAEGADETTDEVFTIAFAQTGEVTAYRMEQATAQTVIIAPLGVDTNQTLDPSSPQFVVEVTPEGQHIVADLGSFFEGLGQDVDLVLEGWQDGDRLVLDTTGFADIPGASVAGTPFEPGIGFVDLRAVADRNTLLLAAIGNAPPDLGSMTAKLPAAIRSVERVSESPTAFAGTITFAEMTEALGGDIEINARSVASGLALSVGVNVDELTQLYVDFYRATDADITITLSDEGLVQVIEVDADLSGVWDLIFADDSPFADELSDAERSEARDLFSDVVFDLRTRIEFFPDADLVLPAAPATDEDRTEVWIEFLETSGF